MSNFYEPVFSDVVKDVIGNEPVLDQFDISYAASFYGSMQDDFITGTMLQVKAKKNSRTKNVEFDLIDERPRGRSQSKYFAGSAAPAESAPNTREVRYNPLASYRITPWTSRVSRSAYRISQCYDSNERYYDTCLPDMAKCFEVDGVATWTVRDRLTRPQPGNNQITWKNVIPFWTSGATVTSSSVAFLYFNGLPADAEERKFYTGLNEGRIFSDNDWTWSYPYEQKYSPLNRLIRNDRSFGLDKTYYIADWNGYDFFNVTSSVSRPIKVRHFLPIMPGKLPSHLVKGARGDNTFRAKYFISGANGTKGLYPSSHHMPRKYAEDFGYSHLVGCDADLSDVDERSGQYLRYWQNVSYWEDWVTVAPPQPLTQSMSFDDTVKFLFGFGDLNNMTYGRRLFSPVPKKETGGSSYLNMTANPTNGQTVSVGGTYTFRNVLAASNDVLIGPDLSSSISNLAAAINGGNGRGTAYHIDTPVNSTVIATDITSASILPTATRNMYVSSIGKGTSVNAVSLADTITSGWITQDLTGAYGTYIENFNVTVTGSSYTLGTKAYDLGTTYTDPDLTIRWEKRSSAATNTWRILAADTSGVSDGGTKLLAISGSGQFYSMSGTFNPGVSVVDGLYWWQTDTASGFSVNAEASEYQPVDAKILVSDTDTTYGGNLGDGGSASAYLSITSSLPWTISYERAIVANTNSRFRAILIGERDYEFADLEWLYGTATGSSPAPSYGVMRRYTPSINGLSGTQAWPYPFDAGKYMLVFEFLNSRGAGGTSLGDPSIAAVNNIKVIQYEKESFPPDTGSIVGCNNYPHFRKLNVDGRQDDIMSVIYRQTSYTFPHFPAWYEPTPTFTGQQIIGPSAHYDIYGSTGGTPNVPTAASFTFNKLIHSGTVFGVSPVIRGWKYGLYSGFPLNTKAVFRRDRFGQLRDMLEQRQYTKFVTAFDSPYEEEPIVRNTTDTEAQRNVATRGKKSLLRAKGVDNISNSPVEVNFVKQRYTRDDRGIGTIYNEKVDPSLTISQNFSTEATSSLPYFDGVARHRQDESLSETLQKQVFALSLDGGSLRLK